MADASDQPPAAHMPSVEDWRAALTPPQSDRLGALTATARVLRGRR